MTARWVLAIGLLALTGCAMVQPAEDETFSKQSQDMSRQASAFRGSDSNLRGFGWSSRAQEIESSLGAQ